MLYFDTETCGLHGVPVLLQYAIDDGEVQLYNFWKNPINKSTELIEWIVSQEVCAFNLSFDWFHLTKIYNIFKIWPDKEDNPEEIIMALAMIEKDARDGVCLKPKAALDLMLHARKGPYQSTMDRSDIKIKRVPTQIAFDMANELETRVPLKNIYFARRADKNKKKWQVEDILDEDGLINPEFKNVVLRFAPTVALKALAVDALDLDVTAFEEITIDKKLYPNELGYAPYAEALAKRRPDGHIDWNGGWPDVIQAHIDHWEYHKRAREYATDDVIYLQKLHEHFSYPEAGDDDSELACAIATLRWKGFTLDLDKIREQKAKAIKKAASAPTAPNYVKNYIWPHLSETEIVILGNSTKKIVLEEIAKYQNENGTPHPAAIKAQDVLDARMAQKEVELFDKLLLAERFHASFKIIGTLSGRMSGADGLNPQAIKATEEVRSCFPLAPKGYELCGGDFDAFEVAIAASYFNDKGLFEELRKGKKIHALFGEELYPEETYESILATKGTDDDIYKKSKSALFAMTLYGGTGHTVKERLGLDEDLADKAKENWAKRFPGIGRKQKEIENKFQSMRQPGGLGSRVEWHEPADYVESMLGFRRYYTLENMIARALFDLGENPPKIWTKYQFKVHRRDRDQTASGAARSACFGAAFAIQGANLRSANNHVIQSTGAQITKALQRRIWDLQPNGIHQFVVMPLNIHDEIMCPCLIDSIDKLKETVNTFIAEYQPTIELIAMNWETGLKSWADK
jgi:hypothetical protein